jgi:PleD family two-component response regulator
MMNERNRQEMKQSILHVCNREVLRPLRDEILKLSGFEVESTCRHDEAIMMYRNRPFSLVLVDVEGDEGVPLAERLCSAVKEIDRDQLGSFVCNWRVALMTDCPDHILRTEFDPAAFVAGVRDMLTPVLSGESPDRL